MRLRVFILLFLLTGLSLYAQTTKVRGRVIDATDGTPVPFAAVFFAGSQVGTSTDLDGRFTLSTRDMSLKNLRVSLVGYRIIEIQVNTASFNDLNLYLFPDHQNLNAVTVKADNRKARRLLDSIDVHRARNNPELRSDYKCNVYSKTELGLTHPREQLRGKALMRQWSFIFDYIDTSEVAGVPYLPIAINESVAERSHTLDPDVTHERITANRLSGASNDGNLIAQFTGSMHLKNNFYSQFINAFNVEIPSPINSSGLLFYNYFIIDSLSMDGRKTYHVRFHPKPGISTPSFDGEMFVDTQDWALRSVKAKMVGGQNINWVRSMQLEAEYRHCDDSTWFYKTDRFFADFSIAVADSSKMISVLGNRLLEFSAPEYEGVAAKASEGVVSVQDDAYDRSDAYWDLARPYQLSQREKRTYEMVGRVQNTSLYTTMYDVVYTLINGYWDFEKVGIGPYLKIFSFNPLEGFRLRFGARTSIGFSRTDRIGVYAAYGFKDRQLKGGVSWEHLFSKDPTSKLTLDAHYDVLQLGRGTNIFNDGNILASVMGAGKSQKLCPVTEGSVLYEREFSTKVNFSANAMYREYHGNSFVPMVTPDLVGIRSIPTTSARVALRFSHDETVIRGHFIKTYTHTDYPVFTLDLGGGGFWMNPSDATGAALGRGSYFIPQLSLDWKFRIPPLGMTTLHANVGTVLGRVPYPLLHIHEGNGTLLLDKTSFSTMHFLEYASDSWATILWDHNFYGFFLGKIPLLKKLQLREAITVKATWGHLSSRNDGSRGMDSESILSFPEGMRPLGKVPYVEAGFAITNILRLLRVDFIWRVTHREEESTINPPRNFVVNIGVELKF